MEMLRVMPSGTGACEPDHGRNSMSKAARAGNLSPPKRLYLRLPAPIDVWKARDRISDGSGTAMHDIVIRGGSIVDGTGAPAFAGRRRHRRRPHRPGRRQGRAGRREVKAEGRLVTPGWVDVHTHYDGQATWDPVLAPSSWHGATTIMFGNCGVGFAPVRQQHHQALIDLMEGVEDIPGIALAEGLKWDWESFPEYLDALSRLPRTIDVAAQIAHHPLRVYAMGERAIAREMATAEDIELMARLTEEALRAGAFGFTTSRTDQHKTPAGDLVPGRYAEHEELIAIGRAMGRAGRGAFGMLSDFEDEAADFGWMRQVARDSNRPVWFLLTDRSYDPQRWRRLMDGVRASRAAGLPLSAQVAGRPVGLILGLATSLNPFALREGFAELARLSPAEQLARLRDPAVRAHDPVAGSLAAAAGGAAAAVAADRHALGPHVRAGRAAGLRAAAGAQHRRHGGAAGQSPQEYCYDYPDRRRRRADAVLPRHQLRPWRPGGGAGDDHGPAYRARPVRWRGALRGDLRCLAQHHHADALGARPHARAAPAAGVRHQAADQRDRGLLRLPRPRPAAGGQEGRRQRHRLRGAAPHHPEMIFDLPAGGRRLVQRVDGYDMTICSGVPIFEKGEETGARPGKLVRSTG